MKAPVFTVKGVLSKAWQLVSGSKWPIWAPIFSIAATSIAVQYALTLFLEISPDYPTTFFHFFLSPVITNIAIAPFFAGAVMVAVKRVRGEPVTGKTGYGYFSNTAGLMLALFIIGSLSNGLLYAASIPSVIIFFQGHSTLLEAVAGIVSAFIYVFFMLSVPLIADKNVSAFRALSQSVKLIKTCWFRALLILLTGYALITLSMLPTVFGLMTHPLIVFLGLFIFILILIWLLPFLFLLEATIYHKLVDTAEE